MSKAKEYMFEKTWTKDGWFLICTSHARVPMIKCVEDDKFLVKNLNKRSVIFTKEDKAKRFAIKMYKEMMRLESRIGIAG